MQQMKTQGAMAGRLLAFLLVTFFAVGPAFGQTGQVERVQIPYEFTVGSKVLPAGTYTLSVTPWGLQVQPATGESVTAHILARLGGPTEFLRDGALVFDKTGGGRILSEVWMPATEGRQTEGILVYSTPQNPSREIFMFTSGLEQNVKVSGRVAYDRTCSKCHGPTGKGDKSADKFFNITIPRLSSAEVQGKSDAELREIITKGSSAMPPVEIDEGGFRHRLPPQEVDAVIAFVRTLKQ
jgi:mono/diheme cytochrome c family protein